MLKVSFFRGEDERGIHVIPLFGPSDRVFEKTAAPTLLPSVSKYIENLRPQKDSQYVLLNAMGALEYWGSNINGDGFPEASLIHAPRDLTGNPLVDIPRTKNWAYGYPTFYQAHPYAHHRNKDASRAFGSVELAVWHPKMKRVELVARVDKDKCDKFGGTGVWDKLAAGQFVDVSMGCRVPYDTCSICLDWDTYRKAQATFDPKTQKSPGEAVLAHHKKLIAAGGKGIRGLSITRKDYCEHALKQMNRILPDGRKVFVYNDYPKFFDISFVFIGADKTAKVMMKIAHSTSMLWGLPGAELAEKLGYDKSDELLAEAFDESSPAPEEKTAAVSDELKLAFLGKQAKDKEGEIVKDVIPSQFAGKAVPLLTKTEEDLPPHMLDALGGSPLESALSTTAGMGMVLRPREFQRIMLIQIGRRPLADELDAKGDVFPKVKEETEMPMGPDFFSSALARMLLPMMDSRSAFGPAIEKRVLVAESSPKEKRAGSSSLSSSLLRKIASAYNGYRTGIMELVANSQDLLASTMSSSTADLRKFSSASVEEVFTPLSVAYLKTAYLDEVQECISGDGAEKTSQAKAGVERGSPSKNTWIMSKKTAGGF